MTYHLTAIVEQDPETKLLVGLIPSIPGAHSQATSMDELIKNLKEVTELCLAEQPELFPKGPPEFVGLQRIEIST